MMLAIQQLLALALLLTVTLAQDDGSRACVSLLQYKHRDCGGDPIQIRNHTVWTQKGSSCRHDVSMGHNSVTDEYCSQLDTDSPVYHQKVFVKSSTCHVARHQTAYSPQHLTYTAKKCTYGYRLNACTPGPCETDTISATSYGEQDGEETVMEA